MAADIPDGFTRGEDDAKQAQMDEQISMMMDQVKLMMCLVPDRT